MKTYVCEHPDCDKQAEYVVQLEGWPHVGEMCTASCKEHIGDCLIEPPDDRHGGCSNGVYKINQERRSPFPW